MPKDINVKETFTLKVKRDIISNIDVEDNLSFVLVLLLQSELKENGNKIIFKCDMDEFDFYKKNFKSIGFVQFSKNKNKVEIKLDKIELKNYLELNDKDLKRDIINYFINNNKIQQYIKYNFILYGTIADPNNSYHIELKMSDELNCFYFVNCSREYDLNFKYIKRKSGDYIYIKEAEKIADFLRVVESNSYLLEFENLRVFKEVRNDINRKQNCEIANLNKVISASVKQQNAIKYIYDTVGLDYLSDELKEIAIIRLETENLTLQEIGKLTSNKIGKSTVNYRLKKIINISEELRRQKNGKS